jgi:hypothetical protein
MAQDPTLLERIDDFKDDIMKVCKKHQMHIEYDAQDECIVVGFGYDLYVVDDIIHWRSDE